MGGSGAVPGREGRTQSWRRDQTSRPVSDRLDCACLQRHSVFMSLVWVSAVCGTVATEDGVCGCFLNICRYLNRHHQSSFTELNPCSVQIDGNCSVIFFQEIEVLMSDVGERHVGVTVGAGSNQDRG